MMIDPVVTPTLLDQLTALATALAPWAAVAAGLLAWLQSRKNSVQIKKTDEAVAINTEITAATARETTDQSGKIVQIHTLVNNMNTSGLGREALLSERLAVATGLNSDRVAADSAREAFDSKVVTDKRAQASIDATAEAVSVAQAANILDSPKEGK